MPRPKKTDTELMTASFPRVPCKPSQRVVLDKIAKRKGYGGKIAAFIRDMVFKGQLADQAGMSVDNVMLDLADLGRMHQYTKGIPELEELRLSLVKRHMDVIKPLS